VKELGCEVRSVRPHERVKLRVDGELSKHERVVQRLEDGTSEGGSEIDFTCGAVSEPKPHYMSAHMAGF
jgi:hypothetical protein